jgi:hypothetical protein
VREKIARPSGSWLIDTPRMRTFAPWADDSGSATAYTMPSGCGVVAVCDRGLGFNYSRPRRVPRRFGQISVGPNDVMKLLRKSGSLLTLNVLTWCGLSPCARQMRLIVEGLTPIAFDILCWLQCVCPGGVSWVVFVTILCASSGEVFGLPGGRVASFSIPENPLFA